MIIANLTQNADAQQVAAPSPPALRAHPRRLGPEPAIITGQTRPAGQAELAPMVGKPELSISGSAQDKPADPNRLPDPVVAEKEA
jgi:hypothetical protein